MTACLPRLGALAEIGMPRQQLLHAQARLQRPAQGRAPPDGDAAAGLEAKGAQAVEQAGHEVRRVGAVHADRVARHIGQAARGERQLHQPPQHRQALIQSHSRPFDCLPACPAGLLLTLSSMTLRSLVLARYRASWMLALTASPSVTRPAASADETPPCRGQAPTSNDNQHVFSH